VPTPDYTGFGDFSDTSRPRPVRIAAFAGFFAQAVLSVLAILFKLDPTLVGAILGAIAAGSLGGGLFVESKVTPTSSPATLRDDTLVPLVPARPPTGASDVAGVNVT
jgi:hypothetical protein